MSKCENCKWFNTGRIENRCFSCIEQSAMRREDLFEEKPKEITLPGKLDTVFLIGATWHEGFRLLEYKINQIIEDQRKWE